MKERMLNILRKEKGRCVALSFLCLFFKVFQIHLGITDSHNKIS